MRKRFQEILMREGFPRVNISEPFAKSFGFLKVKYGIIEGKSPCESGRSRPPKPMAYIIYSYEL